MLLTLKNIPLVIRKGYTNLTPFNVYKRNKKKQTKQNYWANVRKKKLSGTLLKQDMDQLPNESSMNRAIN